MSSAILYLAIVAIWAVVLVPRWLRPRSAPPVPVLTDPSADWSEPAGPSQDADPAWAPSADEPVAGAGADVRGEADVHGAADVPSENAGTEEAAAQPDTGPSPAIRRAEVVKARRRLLATLVALTVAAAGLVVTGIHAYWIVIPPAVLLLGYLALLRKFAALDAERAGRAARRRHAETRAGAGQEPAVAGEPLLAAPPAVPEPGLGAPDTQPPGAEIIDISGRVGDQVYDQYSDAANRAVGD